MNAKKTDVCVTINPTDECGEYLDNAPTDSKFFRIPNEGFFTVGISAHEADVGGVFFKYLYFKDGELVGMTQ